MRYPADSNNPTTIMELLPRPIKLMGGPLHGEPAEATRDVYRFKGFVYVYAGGPDRDRFRLVQTVIHEMSTEKQKRERAIVKQWFRNLNADPPGLDDIPDWRLNAWLLYLEPKAAPLEVYLEKDMEAVPFFKRAA